MTRRAGFEFGQIPGGWISLGNQLHVEEMPTIRYADGCYLVTENGDEYIDFIMGAGSVILGHSNQDVLDEMYNQLSKGLTYYLPNKNAFELSCRLTESLKTADKVAFTSTGTQATYLALRLARGYTGKNKILKFEGGYHGWHDQSLISSPVGNDSERETINYPEGSLDSAGIPQSINEATLVAPYNDIDTTVQIIEKNADYLAGVIVEFPMRYIPPQNGFEQELQAVCRENDVPFILDEVLTGFRIGWGGSQEYYNLEPDISAFGKVIGGGTPLAAVCGREDIMRQLDTRFSLADNRVVLGGTMNGNPFGTTAGNAVLELLDKRKYSQLNDTAESIRQLLSDVFQDAGIPIQIIGEGPLIDFHITDTEIYDWNDLINADKSTKVSVDKELLRRGILKNVGSSIILSTEHNKKEIDSTEEALKAAVEQVAPETDY